MIKEDERGENEEEHTSTRVCISQLKRKTNDSDRRLTNNLRPLLRLSRDKGVWDSYDIIPRLTRRTKSRGGNMQPGETLMSQPKGERQEVDVGGRSTTLEAADAYD